jgi:hypothetical protein
MKVVVLTFDDGILSHLDFARPLLREYGFNATFFISGHFIEETRRKGFVKWDDLHKFHNEGFELGNHFNEHMIASEETDERAAAHIKWIEVKFASLGLPKPVSLSYPGFNRNAKTMEIARKMGYMYARGGCEKETSYHDYQEGAFGGGYDYAWDNQFNVPCSLFGKKFGHNEFVESLSKIKEREMGVYCIHGFTGDGHIGGALDEFSDISKEDFDRCLDYLYVNDYKVIALRDAINYCDFSIGNKQVEEYRKKFMEKYGQKYNDQFRRRMEGKE